MTVDVEVVEVVEIRLFVQIRLVVGLLKIQIIKAVFTNDVADGVCALKACPGAAHDDMRKAHKYHVGEVFVAAELQQLAQRLLLQDAERLLAVGRLGERVVHGALRALKDRRLVEHALEIAVAAQLVLPNGLLVGHVIRKILPNTVVFHQRKNIFERIRTDVFGEPFHLDRVERHIVGVVAEVGFLGGLVVVVVIESTVQLDHDQAGILLAQNVFELRLVVEDRIGLRGKDVARQMILVIDVTGSDIGIRLAGAHKHHVERIVILQIEGLETLAVVVGVTEHKLLQNPCRHKKSKQQTDDLDSANSRTLFADRLFGVFTMFAGSVVLRRSAVRGSI